METFTLLRVQIGYKEGMARTRGSSRILTQHGLKHSFIGTGLSTSISLGMNSFCVAQSLSPAVSLCGLVDAFMLRAA